MRIFGISIVCGTGIRSMIVFGSRSGSPRPADLFPAIGKYLIGRRDDGGLFVFQLIAEKRNSLRG
jgi:hypothetical protein